MPTGPASIRTDYASIQQNEVAALQSIYMDDFKSVQVKPAAWSVRLNSPTSVVLIPRP